MDHYFEVNVSICPICTRICATCVNIETYCLTCIIGDFRHPPPTCICKYGYLDIGNDDCEPCDN